MNEKDDSSRFTIRDEEPVPDSIYISDAENLRIEKLSTRVTLVAVLIPCLLVVVLAVAYLDIKHRVINTQHSGSIGVQNLSKDLASRFSNLSLKQAKMEEQLAENANAMKTATAALQVNLKKTTTTLKNTINGKADRAALTAISKKAEALVASLQKEVSDLNTAFSNFDDELSAQILIMSQGLKKDQGRLAEMEKRVQRLDSEKLNKEYMDLALGLERLGLQEMVKDRIREMEKKLTILGKQVDALNRQLDVQSRQESPPPPAASVPAPLPPPQFDTPSGSADMVEQTIN